MLCKHHRGIQVHVIVRNSHSHSKKVLGLIPPLGSSFNTQRRMFCFLYFGCFFHLELSPSDKCVQSVFKKLDFDLCSSAQNCNSFTEEMTNENKGENALDKQVLTLRRAWAEFMKHRCNAR